MKMKPKIKPKRLSRISPRISRRGVLGSAAALAAAPLLTVADVFAATSPALVSAFADDRRSLKATRITASAVGHVSITAETLGNTTLLQFLSRKATAVAVYSAPAGHTVPARNVAAEGSEFMFITKGDITFITETGTAPCGQGSVVLLDGGTVAEKAGAHGYTAIRVRMGAA